MIVSEDPRLRRLSIRSWRRGTKEMDLLLGPYFDRHGSAMKPHDLDLFEALLGENDQDLYAWATGRATAPPEYADLLGRIVEDRAADAG